VEKYSDQPSREERTEGNPVEKADLPEAMAAEHLAEALRDRLASERHWLEVFAGLAGKLRLPALLILLLVLAGLALVWLLQGVVTGLEATGRP
jgi:hypothetical protein